MLGLTAIIETYKGFFTRAFWLSSVLPLVIFANLHLLIAWQVFPRWIDLEPWLKSPLDQLAYVPLVIATVVVVAYALAPVVPLLRLVLEGELLPKWLYEEVRRNHVARARAAGKEIKAAESRYTSLRALTSRDGGRFVSARSAGRELGDITDAAAIGRIDEAIRALQERRDGDDPLSEDELQAASDLLVAALKVNSADLDDAHPRQSDAARLHRAHGALNDLLRACAVEAEYQLKNIYLRYASIAHRTPQATRMADTRVLIEGYSSKVYDVDFSYIWPRLQLVMAELRNEDAIKDQLDRARLQVDFAVLSLALSFTLPVVWLPVIAVTTKNILLFLAVGSFGPLLSFFFYELVIQSQVAFGEIVKVAVDRHRLEVLAKLHQPAPGSLKAERELWARLRRAEQAPGTVETQLLYRSGGGGP